MTQTAYPTQPMPPPMPPQMPVANPLQTPMPVQPGMPTSQQPLSPTYPQPPVANYPPANPMQMQANYAGFGRRFAAVFIDGILLGVVNVVLNIISTVVTGVLSASSDSTTTPAAVIITGVVGLLNIAINFVYSIYFIGTKGQTPGKMALGIKVISKANPQQKLGYTTAFLREVVGKLVSGIVLSLGYLWAIWDDEKQTWHDKIANTVVIRV